MSTKQGNVFCIIVMTQIYFAEVEPLYSLDKQLKGQNFFCVEENTFIVEREKQNMYYVCFELT